ncbi:hypothetical protein REPUB_Repub03eG0151700 [Reevesia pubescens]
MGCVETVAHLGGSQVLGIILRALAIRNITGKTVGDEIMVSCLHERMNIMIEMSMPLLSYLVVLELWKRSSKLHLGHN